MECGRWRGRRIRYQRKYCGKGRVSEGEVKGEGQRYSSRGAKAERCVVSHRGAVRICAKGRVFGDAN